MRRTMDTQGPGAPNWLGESEPINHEETKNHEVERLAEILGGMSGEVTVQESWSLLQVHNYCFSLARAHHQWKPCLYVSDSRGSVTTEELAGLLGEPGGFSIPISDIIDD
jgi:hypothetical protein